MWNNKLKVPCFLFLADQPRAGKKKGFTILEVIISILVVTIGVLSVYTVTQQIVSYTYHSAFRLTAVYLGEEGIEIVRNIRDTNWLKGVAWNNGLGVGAWEADYNTIQPLSDTYDGESSIASLPCPSFGNA